MSYPNIHTGGFRGAYASLPNRPREDEGLLLLLLPGRPPAPPTPSGASANGRPASPAPLLPIGPFRRRLVGAQREEPMRRRDVGRPEVGAGPRPVIGWNAEGGARAEGLQRPEGGEEKMAAAAAETVELHKLKLAELKQECLARGLEAKGNKQDLINRLQTYLEQHAEEEANEEDVLGEETEEEEQKPLDAPVKEEVAAEKSAEVGAEKKVVKITSEIPQMERMQKRAERFNVPVSLESKKAARAARFGMSTASTKGLVAESKTTTEEDEKLKKRKERFGIVTSSAGTGTTEDTEAKKRKRAERFGLV